MFRRDVQSISDLLNMYLRREGLETPLLQKRAVDAWDTLMGPSIARYTGDLTMMRSRIVKRINEAVGSQVIVDVRIY